MSLFRALLRDTCPVLLLVFTVLFLVAPQALSASQGTADADPVPIPSGSVQAVKVTSVSKSKLKSGSAFQFGLEPGDLIYALNGRRISSAEELQAYIKDNHSSGEIARLRYLRGSQAFEVTDLPYLVQDGFIKSHLSVLWGGDFETATVDVPASVAQNALVRLQRGVVLKSISPGLLAEKAELKPGDVILAVDNKLVNNPANLPFVIYSKKVNETFPIIYLRDGKELKVEVSVAGIRKYSWGIKAESEIITLTTETAVAAAQPAAPVSQPPPATVAAMAAEPAPTAALQPATTAAQTPSATPVASVVASSPVIPVPVTVKGWPVSAVAPDGPAAKAGILPGDFITHLNGFNGNDSPSPGDILPKFERGQTVTISLYRGNQPLQLSVALGVSDGRNYLGITAETATERNIAGIPWPVVSKPELAPGLSYPMLQSIMLPAWYIYQSAIQAQPTRTINTSIRLKHDWIADGDLPCGGAPVDIVYANSGTAFANFVRLVAPTCSGGSLTSPGIVVESSGRVLAGEITMYKGNLKPSYTPQFEAYSGGARYYTGSAFIARQDSFGNLLLAKNAAQPLDVVTLAYLSLKNVGYFDLEAGFTGYFDLAKTKVFHGDGYTITADGFQLSYKRGEDETTTNFQSSFLVIRATGHQRWDTAKPTAAGPAGTYYASGTRRIDKITEIVPSPGTLAQFAREAQKCPYQPPVPEGFLLWSGTCKPDYISAYSIDGQFALFFDKDKNVTIAGLNPEKPGIIERHWTSASITNTNPPLPIGTTEVFNDRSELIYRGNLLGYNPDGEGECPVPNTTEFEPCTWKDGRRTDIAFLARERQRQLDAVAARQQQQAQASLAAAQQQRNDEAARRAELNRIAELERRAEEAAERREEEARSQARWAETFASISNTFAQSQAEVAANQRRAEHLRAQQAAAQAHREREKQDNDAAYRRQQVQNINAATAKQEAIANQNAQKRATEEQRTAAQSDAMANALAAQRAASQEASNGAGARTPVNSRVPSAPPTAPTNTQRAPATPQTSQVAQSTAAGQAKVDPCFSDAKDACMPNNSKPSTPKTPAATSAKSETAPTKNTGLVDWPEGIAVCTQLKNGMRCSGPFTTTGDSVDQACSGSGTRHNYGTQNGFIVWGCGFGIDSPGKNDLFHQQNHRDMASRYGLHLPDRRTYACPAGQVNPTYCHNER